ncbi:unnamed protein product [Arabidopsis halleri]
MKFEEIKDEIEAGIVEENGKKPEQFLHIISYLSLNLCVFLCFFSETKTTITHREKRRLETLYL